MNKNQFLKLLLAVVLVNYAAQLPYYIYQYYALHHFMPSLYGLVLLSLTLMWFIAAYWLIWHSKQSGYWLMLTFLGVEFLFYLQTQISQLLISHQLLLHVIRPDGVLLFLVFGVGYLNFFAAAYFIGHLLRHKPDFVS